MATFLQSGALDAFSGGAAMSTEKLLYTVEEAASQLGLKPSWLYERTRRNELPCRRLGKYLRFSEEDLQDIIAKATAGRQED
jgi:excisionase family DNA binding protein